MGDVDNCYITHDTGDISGRGDDSDRSCAIKTDSFDHSSGWEGDDLTVSSEYGY